MFTHLFVSLVTTVQVVVFRLTSLRLLLPFIVMVGSLVCYGIMVELCRYWTARKLHKLISRTAFRCKPKK